LSSEKLPEKHQVIELPRYFIKHNFSIFIMTRTPYHTPHLIGWCDSTLSFDYPITNHKKGRVWKASLSLGTSRLVSKKMDIPYEKHYIPFKTL
jgi:hypothetical protein